MHSWITRETEQIYGGWYWVESIAEPVQKTHSEGSGYYTESGSLYVVYLGEYIGLSFLLYFGNLGIANFKCDKGLGFTLA
jgi:hypothetical protein